MNHWVHDYETLSNCFCGVFTHYKTEETKIFRVDRFKNDIKKFIKFLESNIKNKEWHISFNGLAFDSQITEYILENKIYFQSLEGEDLAIKIYQYAQLVIKKSNNNEWSDYAPWKLQIKQIDVYKLNHWDNAAKRSSLKWIQYSTDWYNLQDMPIEHTKEITTEEEIKDIIEYCINDVKSTKHILYLSKKEINLRNKLSKEYKIDLYNASEPKISKELFLDFIARETKKPKNYFKYKKTLRDIIIVKNIILEYIDFKIDKFKKIHESFKELIIDPKKTKGAIKLNIIEENLKIDFGLGGIHGATKSGIYKKTENTIIMSSDVKSYYPNLAIRNKWSPEHLPKHIFCKLYEWFYDERLKIPKSDIRNYIYKIILNATYGLSNDYNSFLYDPLFTMRITINGQLSLLMLYEKIIIKIPSAKLIMINTDGLEIIIPKDKKEEYLKICKEWENMTDLVLEHSTYQKIILGDVNNYIAVHDFEEITKEDYLNKKEFDVVKKIDNKYFKADTKCKGRFAFEDIPLHKNKSNLASRKAIFKFFLLNTPPEKTITNNTNIFDFCIGKKIKGDWYFESRFIKNSELINKKEQKTLRYFISKNGTKLIKVHKHDERETQLEAGHWLTTIFNKYEKKNMKDYNIDYSYYIKAVYNEVYNILNNNQTKLIF